MLCLGFPSLYCCSESPPGKKPGQLWSSPCLFLNHSSSLPVVHHLRTLFRSLSRFLILYGRRARLVTVTLPWLKLEVPSDSVLLSISLLSCILKYFKYKKDYTSLILQSVIFQEPLVSLSEEQYLETKISSQTIHCYWSIAASRHFQSTAKHKQ